MDTTKVASLGNLPKDESRFVIAVFHHGFPDSFKFGAAGDLP